MTERANKPPLTERPTLTARAAEGVAIARDLGPDLPPLAETYFNSHELAEIKKLDLGLWRPKSKPRHWVDTTSSVVERWLDCLPADNPQRPLLQKLARGLGEASQQRSIQTVDALGAIVFARERDNSHFIPLDEALARVAGFGDGALGAHLELLSTKLLHELARNPGRFIPQAPSQLKTPADLAIALWGENNIHDHIDLTSKVIHLHHVARLLGDYGLLVNSPIYKAAEGLRAELVRAVDYEKKDPPKTAFERLKALAPPELTAAGCGFTIAEQLVRADALQKAIPPLADALTGHVAKLKGRLDVSAEETRLKGVTVAIEFLAAEKIRQLAFNPLRDHAFQRAIEAEPRLRNMIDKLEVGGMLFGRVEAGGQIHITDIIPHSQIKVGISARGPYITLDTEHERKRIAALERPGYTFLGDWHVHPPYTWPCPSVLGDPTIHRGLLGDSLFDGRVTVQLIVTTGASPEATRIFPYAYHPFKRDREVSPEGFSRRFFQIDEQTATVPALIEPKELSLNPRRFLDGIRLKWWERQNPKGPAGGT